MQFCIDLSQWCFSLIPFLPVHRLWPFCFPIPYAFSPACILCFHSMLSIRRKKQFCLQLLTNFGPQCKDESLSCELSVCARLNQIKWFWSIASEWMHPGWPLPCSPLNTHTYLCPSGSQSAAKCPFNCDWLPLTGEQSGPGHSVSMPYERVNN